MECKSLRSKAFPVSLAIALFAVAGCGDPEKLNLAPKPLFEDQTAAKTPDFGEKTPIHLANESESLHVGDPLEPDVHFFTKPSKAYDLRELPNVLGAGFRAQGWENEVEGFGAVGYEGKVAAALRILHKVDEVRVQSEIAKIKSHLELEPEPILHKRSRYWFWESGRHRQMVCAVQEGQDSFTLTIAIGELNTMNALRMNPRFADFDGKRADRAPLATETK